MRSRLVGALAAIALIAAMWLDVGVARADTMPIHRGLPSDGYGEPEGGGEIHELPEWFRIISEGQVNFSCGVGRTVAGWMMTRFKTVDRTWKLHWPARGSH